MLPLLFIIACNNADHHTKTVEREVVSAAPTTTTTPAPKSEEQNVSGLFAAKGQDVFERSISRESLYVASEFPKASVDILAQLGVHLINEMPEETGVTDEDVRAAADISYSRLGIADEELRGWTLFVRSSNNGMNATSFNEKKKFIVIEMDPPMFPFAGPHELTHALSGKVMREDRLPGIMSEFVATAAEIYQPPGSEFNPFSYEILNRPILGTGKNQDGKADRIHAVGAPLDAMRYELLRQAGKKIGDDAYRSLATEIYKTAAKKDGPVLLDDLQPVFAQAGIGDCVLFTHTEEPGVYVDLAIATNHAPIVLTKYIDGQGQESMVDAPFSLTWRKGGRTINKFEGTAAPIFTDDGSVPFGGMMDEYVVKVGNLSYTYVIKDRSQATTDYLTPDKLPSTK